MLMTEDHKDEIDKLQIRYLKEAMKIHTSYRNTLLRLMTDVQRFDIVRKQRSIKFIKKCLKMDDHRGPRKMVKEWEKDRLVQVTDNTGMTKTIDMIQLGTDETKKFECTNLRKIWSSNWNDIYNRKWEDIKRNLGEEEKSRLLLKLIYDVHMLDCAKKYITPIKGHDKLLDSMHATQLSQFLNVVCCGHPMY